MAAPMETEPRRHGAVSEELSRVMGSYDGSARLKRLDFLSKKALEQGDDEGMLEVSRRLHGLLKEGQNTVMYTLVCQQIAGKLGPEFNLDAAWVAKADKAAKANLDRLEQDLQVSKTNSMKDNIRMGCNDIGEHHERRGDLTQALRSFLRNRDYCHPAKYELEFVLNVLRTKINIPHLHQIESFATKGEKNQCLEPQPNESAAATRTRSVLQARMKGKYKAAARRFVHTEHELVQFDGSTQPFPGWAKHVVAPRDVAVYGGLCALAEFDRDELKRQVIDESCSFRHFLELCPSVREIVADFYCSRYPSCLRALSEISASLVYDLHISSHVQALRQKIYSRALIQYFHPYTKLDLRPMSSAFNVDLATLEGQLVELISSGRILARIDSDKKHLIAQQVDERAVTFDRSLTIGREVLEGGAHLLLRTNLARMRFLAKPSPRANGSRPRSPDSFDGYDGQPRAGGGECHPGQAQRRRAPAPFAEQEQQKEQQEQQHAIGVVTATSTDGTAQQQQLPSAVAAAAVGDEGGATAMDTV